MQAKFSLRGTKHHDLLQHDFPEAVFLCNGQMRVEEADSAGAGDTYDGAFIAALMDGKDLWSAGVGIITNDHPHIHLPFPCSHRFVG